VELHDTRHGRLWFPAVVGLAAAVGLFLRIYRINTQFPTNDEWHALVAAVNFSFADLLTSFLWGGHAIPHAIYYRALLKLTGITEIGIYVPFALAGTAIVIVVPWLTRDLLGKTASALLAWSIALAPLFLFYGRYARPYAMVAFFSFVALWYFERWRLTRSAPHALGYGVSGALAAYFHVVAIPFVVTPIILSALRDTLVMRRGIGRCLMNAAGPALALGVVLALFIGVPVWNSFSIVSGRAAQGTPTLTSVFDAYRVMVGSREWEAVVIFTALARLGAWAMLRKSESRFFAILLLSASAVQVATVLLTNPVGVEESYVLARYVIAVALVLLVFFAAGFAHAIRNLGKISAAAAALVFIAYALNSSAWIVTRYNTETNLYVLAYLLFGKSFERLPRDFSRHPVPAFYEELARHPAGEMTIVEAPFRYDDAFLISYQLLHRQRVLMGLTEQLCGKGDPYDKPIFDTYKQTRLKNLIDLSDMEALRRREVDYLIFHRSIAAETTLPERFSDSDEHVAGCIAQYARTFGRPVFDDGEVVVFAVSGRARQLHQISAASTAGLRGGCRSVGSPG